MEYLELYPQFRAMVLAAIPPILQSICAAFGDFYTWRLAERIYGRGSNTAWAAVRSVALLQESTYKTDGPLVVCNDLESLAVVLFNKNLVELRRDYIDNSRSELLAVGLGWRYHFGDKSIKPEFEIR